MHTSAYSDIFTLLTPYFTVQNSRSILRSLYFKHQTSPSIHNSVQFIFYISNFTLPYNIFHTFSFTLDISNFTNHASSFIFQTICPPFV